MAEEAPMFERSVAERVWAPCHCGRGAQGTGNGFIVPGAAPVANGFGYFCLDKSNPRDSAEAVDLDLAFIEVTPAAIQSRMKNIATHGDVTGCRNAS